MWHIGRVSGFAAVLAVTMGLFAPAEVVAQKKKAVDNGYAATPVDYQNIQNKKELVGTVVTVSGKVVTLRVDTPHMEPNPKFKPVTNPKAPGYNPQTANQYKQVQEAQRLQRELQQAQNANNPQERARAMQRYYQDLARHQQQMQKQYAQMLSKAAKDPKSTKNNANNTQDPFIVVHSYKEYDLEAQDNVVVRKLFLPFEYDDMGNIKQYTDKEKAELKGDDKLRLGGYKSKIEELAFGMEAKLTLTPPKVVKKKEAKADEEGVGNVERPTIATIVLTKDNPAGSVPVGADPKKKKDKK